MERRGEQPVCTITLSSALAAKVPASVAAHSTRNCAVPPGSTRSATGASVDGEAPASSPTAATTLPTRGTLSPSHLNSCLLGACAWTYTLSHTAIPAANAFMRKTENARKHVRVRDVFNVSALRPDAPPGRYGELRPGVRDCSHWCLPGVPDAWNQ